MSNYGNFTLLWPPSTSKWTRNKHWSFQRSYQRISMNLNARLETTGGIPTPLRPLAEVNLWRFVTESGMKVEFERFLVTENGTEVKLERLDRTREIKLDRFDHPCRFRWQIRQIAQQGTNRKPFNLLLLWSSIKVSLVNCSSMYKYLLLR